MKEYHDGPIECIQHIMQMKKGHAQIGTAASSSLD